MDKLTAKGTYVTAIYRMSPEAQVEFLRQEFIKAVLSEDSDQPLPDYQGRVHGIMEMLNDRGSMLSSNMNKLFSIKGGTSRDTSSLKVDLDDEPSPVKQERGPGDSDGESLLGSAASSPSRTKRSPERGSEGLEEAIREQSRQIAEAVQMALGQKKETRHSVVKVSPTIRWPVLADDGPDSKDVEEFYDKYEELCSLANDGRGMNPKEHLRTLQSCLRGSKEKIYRLVYKRRKLSGLVDEDPDKVFAEIKERHMKFKETLMEKQMRVTAEWDRLWKGSKTAFQFEAEVEELSTELTWSAWEKARENYC
jgi:hypothetical protein